jgi:HTH-type transcriptional regulator/antitoxin HipB
MPTVTTAREVGALIRQRRRELGLGQGELASKVGVSRQWIVAIERGKPGAALGLVLRTLGALQLDVTIDGGKGKTGRRILAPDIDEIVRRARRHP